MRADRLLQALFVLQSRARVTAAELAEELQVSVPTARRDLAALSASGVPVYPVSGRGGGWQLVGGARTNLTGLTRDESHDLFALLGQVQSTSPSAAAAIRKLLQALPEPFREGAARASTRTSVGPAWGELAAAPAPAQAELVGRAVALGRCVSADHRGRRIRFAPLGIGSRGSLWYALAVRPDGDHRLYRLDRMSDVAILDERARFPAGVDFATTWAEAMGQVEALRGGAAAIVVVSGHAAQPLMDAFGVLAEVLARTAGDVTLRLRAQDERALVEQLAGWVDHAEVREPASVRAALASLGERLVRTYAE